MTRYLLAGSVGVVAFVAWVGATVGLAYIAGAIYDLPTHGNAQIAASGVLCFMTVCAAAAMGLLGWIGVGLAVGVTWERT